MRLNVFMVVRLSLLILLRKCKQCWYTGVLLIWYSKCNHGCYTHVLLMKAQVLLIRYSTIYWTNDFYTRVLLVRYVLIMVVILNFYGFNIIDLYSAFRWFMFWSFLVIAHLKKLSEQIFFYQRCYSSNALSLKNQIWNIFLFS